MLEVYCIVVPFVSEKYLLTKASLSSGRRYTWRVSFCEHETVTFKTDIEAFDFINSVSFRDFLNTHLLLSYRTVVRVELILYDKDSGRMVEYEDK